MITFISILTSKNCLARNIGILQDLAQNLASLALKIKLFLQDMKNLVRILQENLQDNFLARF